ncbi:MAG: hypothetical protein J6A04_04955 [Clostridia bacterium]|nr:hypothetical protein [Clostridia bacterium]
MKKKEEKENKEVDSKQVKKGIEQLEKERMYKKHLPKEEENKINKKVFENILIADVLMVFLYFIGLGSLNIETPIFVTDLKVFSIGLIIFTIILFEVGYKKDSANLAIHGIECLIVSIFILFSNYIYIMNIKEFHIYVAIFSYISAIYYVGKSIILYRKMKKKYIASLSDINEITKK